MRFEPIIAQMPHMLHGGDYNPDQWLKMKDTIWPEDIRLAKLAGCNAMSVGIFAWAQLEPEEGRYDFSWLDEVMDMLAANGMAAVLATPSGARPAWMSEKYPEVLRVSKERVRDLHGGRHNHCLTSPLFREKITALNTALAERYKDHPALGMWHISNEYGGECHCPLCQEKFRGWLQKRYGTLEKLNEAYWSSFWSANYTSWSQLESPSPLGMRSLMGLKLDWKRFTTEQFADFMNCETEPLRRITPHVKTTTNLMGTNPGINYFRLSDCMDVASWDNYPVWKNRTPEDAKEAARVGFMHDLCRSFKNRPFLMMESSPSATNWQPVAKLRRPGGHKLYSLQAVAHGSDSVQYFQMRKGRGGSEQFHGAVIDHEGTENTRVFREVASVGETLKKLDSVVGTPVRAEAAILYDWENAWGISFARGMLNEKGYDETVFSHHRSFWKQGIACDVVDETRPLDGYKVLAAPMAFLLRPGFAERVKDFVRNGGTLVATYMTGYVDESELAFLGGFPGPLKEVFGIWDEEIDALYPEDRNRTEYKGRNYEVKDFCEILHLRGAEALAVYGEDFYAGTPTLTVNRYGKGKAYYIACRTEQAFLDEFYKDLAQEAGLTRALEAELPEGVSAVCRTDGKEETLFVMNFAAEEQSVDAGRGGTDLETGEEAAGLLVLPPRSCRILRRK